MPNASLFQKHGLELPAADTLNEAGGRAFTRSPKEALCQLALTGCFNQTYYADAETQLKTIAELAEQVEPFFLAQLAVYAREKGHMKDAPAFLLAILSRRSPTFFRAAFPRVCDGAKTLRGFVQIMRSGTAGRKSLGSAPKQMVRSWFTENEPETIFRQSVGDKPSLGDLIRMVHPKPKNPEQEAFFAYLFDKKHDATKLPEIVREYEAFRTSPTLGTSVLPRAPFEMLSGLSLDPRQWRALARQMSWTQLRMNLNLLAKNGVFKDPETRSFVVSKLSDPEQIARAKAMPYQMYAAWKFTEASMDVPMDVRLAIAVAAEHAVKNVPAIEGDVALLLDISASMHSPVTGSRPGATSKVECSEVAALMVASILRKNPTAEVVPFHTHVLKGERLNPMDSLMTLSTILRRMPSGGTNCACAVEHLNHTQSRAKTVILVSDNQSWAEYQQNTTQPIGFGVARSPFGSFTRAPSGLIIPEHTTGLASEWAKHRRRVPGARLALIDLQPYTSTQIKPADDVLLLGGWSDHAYELLARFASGAEMSLTQAVEAVEI